MGYIETQFETRYCCEFCGEPVGLYKLTALVNFDPEAAFAASLEADFKAEQATDGEMVVDCSCQKREQIGSYTLLTSTHIAGTTTITLFETESGYSPAAMTVAVKKHGRNSYRVVDESVFQVVKFGPVFRSRRDAEKRAAEEVLQFKAWCRELAAVNNAAKDAE